MTSRTQFIPETKKRKPKNFGCNIISNKASDEFQYQFGVLTPLYVTRDQIKNNHARFTRKIQLNVLLECYWITCVSMKKDGIEGF